MANLLPAFIKTLHQEGGYVNHPADRGGATKFGISTRSYPELDIKNLTVEEAIAIYRKDYWEPIWLDKIDEQAVAEEIFDTAVNMGTKRAIKIAQTALNYLGCHLKVDGIMGHNTLGFINGYSDTQALLKALNGVQFMNYLHLVEHHKDQAVFARGWLKRITF